MTTIVNNKSNIKKACLCLLILFLICKVNLQSQNLVVNGSFERNSQNIKVTCGSNFIDYNRMMNQNLCDKSCGSPDIFIENKISNSNCIFKKAIAYDGTVGVFIGRKQEATTLKEYNEHLILAFSEELIRGRYYILSFYANNFSDIYFSNANKMLSNNVDNKERKEIEARLFSKQNDDNQVLRFTRTPDIYNNGYGKYECVFKCQHNTLSNLKIGFIGNTVDNSYFPGQGINFEGYLIDNIELYLSTDSLYRIHKSSANVDYNTTNSVVYFESNSSQLTDQGVNLINTLGKQEYIKTVRLDAFSSALGQEDYNYTLARKRAMSVKKALEQNSNITSIKINVIGETHSSLNDHSDKGALRRVDIVILDRKETKRPFSEYQTSDNCSTAECVSWTGNSRLAKHINNPTSLSFSKKQIEKINSGQVINAEDYILTKSKDHEIIVINEAHHIPDNRVFISKLLPSLKKQGYTKLFVEALPNDIIISPYTKCITASGYYLSDPVFIKYLQIASNLGFTIFGYEESAAQVIENDSIVKSLSKDWLVKKSNIQYIVAGLSEHEINRRDYSQYKNIESHIKENAGKSIIHCGYDHVKEEVINNWKTVTSWLKDELRIDPLTIDQANYSNYDTINYTEIKKLSKRKRPFIIFNGYDRASFYSEYDVISGTRKNLSDIFVFYPDDIHNYKLNNFANTEFHSHFDYISPRYNQNELDYPHLIIAIDSGCQNIVLDIMEVTDKTDNVILEIKKNTNPKFCIKLPNNKIIYLGDDFNTK